MPIAIANQFPAGIGVAATDSPSIDAFSRWRVSNPIALHDAQFTYDLHPLLYEQIVSGDGASVVHSSTERAALMTFSTTPATGKAYMQSYEHFRYQPGNGHLVFVTFNFVEAAANVLKFAGYGDYQTNGIAFELNGSVKQWSLYSNTSAGDDIVEQDDWNLDPLDGTGPSGVTLDITKTQIAVIDFQALYVGRVRVGFDIDGLIVYCHEFLHANRIAYPYIQTASLPVVAGMTCSDTASTTMLFICAAVKSEGGSDEMSGYTFSADGSVSASSGARTHILSVRPRTTFNSIATRERFQLDSVDVLVTGNSPVLWELCVGQAISGTTAFTAANDTYSAYEYNTAGTISGSPAIVIASGFCPASAQNKTTVTRSIVNRFPITLDAAGAVRALGTLSLIVTGLGGASATRAAMNWREIR